MNRINFLVLIFLSASFESVSQENSYKGIGVVYLKKSLTEEETLTNTMKIYNTNKFRNVEAEMTFNLKDRFDLRVVSNKIQKNAFFEFEYESFGLPIIEIKNRYFKVLYGYDQTHRKLIGFIPIDTINYGYRLWDKFFLEGTPIFFKRDLALEFFDRINGEKINIGLETIPDGSGRKNYIMYPLRIERKWMKVKLVTPSDYCAEVESKISEVWINYLNKDCELRIWYYVRGC